MNWKAPHPIRSQSYLESYLILYDVPYIYENLMESWHIFIFGVLFVNAVVGHRNTKQETKRLLDGLDSNLMHQLQLKIQNLESTVSQLQQTVQSM